MQVVIGHIAFKGENGKTLTYPTSDTDDPDQHQNLHGWLRRGYDENPTKNGVDRMQGGGGVYTDMQTYNKKFSGFFFFRFLFPSGSAQPKTAGAILMVNGSKRRGLA
jgi:hypothetical protein